MLVNQQLVVVQMPVQFPLLNLFKVAKQTPTNLFKNLQNQIHSKNMLIVDQVIANTYQINLKAKRI